MKHTLILGAFVLALIPVTALAATSAPAPTPERDYIYQHNETDLDFVTKPAAGTVAPSVATSTPSHATTDFLIKLPPIEGETEGKGNVEHEWKVEEGESVADTEEAEALEHARAVLEEGAKAADQAIESLSLNYEKITTRVRHEVKLFGVIPVTALATVEIDTEDRVKVRFPWWAFLASGKDDTTLGERVFTTVSNVLKTRHDTVKNSIGNIR